MTTITQLKKQWIGKEYPVWWETEDKRPAGQHKARVINVLPYTGAYEFTCVFRLACPSTRRGWLEMAISPTDLKHNKPGK